jgi:hypothetical protein
MAFTGFRAPALPIPGGMYEQRQQAELIRALRLYFNILDSLTPQQAQSYTADAFFGGSFTGTNISGDIISGFGSGIEVPYAMLMSDQDQTSAGATSENILSYNQIIISQGISVEDNTKIRFAYSGQYLVTFTLQVTNNDNQIREFEVWAKNNGTNYPLSNRRFDIPAKKGVSSLGHAVPAITGIFSVQQDEYLEIAWWGETTDIRLEHYAAGTSPTRPAIPSVILTVQFVAALPKKFYTILPDRLSISGAAPTILRGAAPSPSASTLSIVGSAPTVTIA